MTEDNIEAPESEAPEAPEQDSTIPLYVYAVVMLPDGELKLVTELPFAMERKAHSSDVIMTAKFIAEQVKSGAPF